MCLKALDSAQRIDFVGRLLRESRMLLWIQEWGWAVGLAWLFILVMVWPERKGVVERAVSKTRAEENLRRATTEFLRRLAKYEQSIYSAGISQYAINESAVARDDFRAAFAHLMHSWLELLPVGERMTAEYAIMASELDLYNYMDETRGSAPHEIIRLWRENFRKED